MILAAGLGSRMQPLTRATPKPLIRVLNKTLLDHGLDALATAGVSQAVVNVHYLAGKIVTHVKNRKTPQVVISDERDELLDSGGGVKNALPLLGENPFFLLNADSFWMEGAVANLDILANAWSENHMDILLLLSPTGQAIGFDGRGDFFVNDGNTLSRRGERPSAPYAYVGAGIISPAIFANTPDEPFSLNLLFDNAIRKNRLCGVQMDGLWLHVGTPEAIDLAEQAIAKHAA